MEELKKTIDHLVFQPEPEIDDMVQQVLQAKQKVEEERLLPSIPMSFIPPMILTAQVYAERMRWDKRQQEKKVFTRQTFLGGETYFSSTPLSSLKPSTRSSLYLYDN
jgi:hypothetical protein